MLKGLADLFACTHASMYIYTRTHKRIHTAGLYISCMLLWFCNRAVNAPRATLLRGQPEKRLAASSSSKEQNLHWRKIATERPSQDSNYRTQGPCLLKGFGIFRMTSTAKQPRATDVVIVCWTLGGAFAFVHTALTVRTRTEHIYTCGEAISARGVRRRSAVISQKTFMLVNKGWKGALKQYALAIRRTRIVIGSLRD